MGDESIYYISVRQKNEYYKSMSLKKMIALIVKFYIETNNINSCLMCMKFRHLSPLIIFLIINKDGFLDLESIL